MTGAAEDHPAPLQRGDSDVVLDHEAHLYHSDGPASAADDDNKKLPSSGAQSLAGITEEDVKKEVGGAGDLETNTPKGQDELPQGRQLGTISATYLIVNRIVGTGVFATTSTILNQSGSVGMSLIYWVIGAAVAFAGFSVYCEFATVLPRNGGELNYLQHAYRKPRALAAVMYAAQAFLLGQAAGNSYTAGRYFQKAGASNGQGDAAEWTARGIGVAVIMAALITHSTALKWGLRFQNAIGTFKLVVLLLISFSGFAALAGRSRNGMSGKENFQNAFTGTRSDAFSIGACLYNTIWGFTGYTNAFYAVGEVQNPTRLMRRAGPLALLLITVLYILVQVAYFAAVPLPTIAASEQIIAADYFEAMFGSRSRQALSVFVALSAVASVFSVIFSQGRLNQALGRDGLIPFSRFFASNKPFKTPMVSMVWQCLMTMIILLAPPANNGNSDVYDFLLNLSSYPLNVVNMAVGLGLLMTYIPRSMRPAWARDWESPYRASLPLTLFFSVASIFLVVVPWIPPVRPQDAVYSTLWYALAPAVSWGFFLLGAIWWATRWWLLPKRGGYTLEPEKRTLSDGTVVTSWEKRYPGGEASVSPAA